MTSISSVCFRKAGVNFPAALASRRSSRYPRLNRQESRMKNRLNPLTFSEGREKITSFGRVRVMRRSVSVVMTWTR